MRAKEKGNYVGGRSRKAGFDFKTLRCLRRGEVSAFFISGEMKQ